MSRADVSIIDRSVQTTNIWLNELAGELGVDDRRYAYRVLRAALHALRDRLTVDEVAQLAAQLPELVRGIYYEGWDPSSTPAGYRDAESFLRRVESELRSDAGDTQASLAVAAVARLLRRHVSAGELDDVMGILPAGVRRLWNG